MKRTISLGLGLLALALLPALAQKPNEPMGKIHGHVMNPTGSPQANGTVTLSNDYGKTSKASFPVSADGEYSGDAPAGTFTVVFRAPDTPPDKVVDAIDNVKIVAGQDTLQDIDMSRKEFVEKHLNPEQRKNLEDMKAKNAAAMKTNEIIKSLNADIIAAAQDFKDATNARATAAQTLGATASKSDLDAKEAEIKTAKYTEVETLMLKDTPAKPDAAILWADLGQAQVGLKKYDDAATNYKKALDAEAASKKPNPAVQGSSYAGLGEIYARTGKIQDANTAYDAAAKINPSSAGVYLKNEAVIFYQMQTQGGAVPGVDWTAAMAAAADEATKADPTSALAWYLKGQGLIASSTADPKTGTLIPPPGCIEAYQKYLELAPTGPFAKDAKDILAEFARTPAKKGK